MPHARAPECVDAAVRACPELPFWPTRPLAVPAEGMTRQWALGLPGVGELPRDGSGPAAANRAGPVLAWVGRDRAPGRAALLPEAGETLDRFLRVLASRPAGWLKLQATGPVTLTSELQADGCRAFSVPSARGPLALGYAARIRSLTTRVREALPAWKVLLVLDEPSLAAPEVAERPQIALELWRTLGATGADVTGLHCCATPPWGLILDLDPQLVSFDAIRDGDAATDDPAFRRLVSSGSAVAWGLVPAGGAADGPDGPDPESRDPDALADRLLDLVEWTAGDYLPEVLARSLVTPTCGLASTGEEEAVRRLALAASVGPRAWALAGLP
jgi:methionine synthase II (cobalamin-independent)